MRYPSVVSLIADVEAWRSGHQVSAYGSAPIYAFTKFIARHRLVAAATVAAFAVLATAFTNTLMANTRAERARDLAEARFAQTRAIANSMLFDVFDEVSLTVGSTNAREMLARTSLIYLEALAADADAPLDVQVEAGLGFLRLSQVVGGGQAGELGRYQDASALLERAAAIIEPLYAAYPQNEPVARAMAQVLLEQSGAALYNANDSAAGRTFAERAAAAIEPYARHDADAARTYAIALQAVADSFGWDDDYASARDRHLRAEAFATSLPMALRDDVKVMRARAANLRLLGEAYHRLEQEDEARIVLDQAVELNRAVRDSAPNNPSYIRNFAISTWYRAVVHRANERDALARASIEESVASARILRERDPSDAGAIRMLAISNEVYAQILADLGDYAGSYTIGAEVIAAHRELVERADGAPGARRSLAAALMTHGGNSYNGAAYARACEAWVEARGVYRALNEEGALGERDRNAALAEAEDFVTRGCGPPRRGLGDTL
jgi:tetratricopeptide (TPR) repeat protein